MTVIKKTVVKTNAMSFAKLIAALVDHDHTSYELAESTGLAYQTVREQLHALHKEKLVYVSGFNKDSRGRDNAFIWGWGNKPDAKRTKLTAAQRQARVRSRRKLAKQLGLL